MEKFKSLDKNKLSKLPKTPGVYVLKKGVELLYIGKAINLKERVKNHNLDKVNKIGYIKTGSGIEALILEAKLIKKYRPKHNVVWRDDKNYFYVTVTEEKFPRVSIVHQITRSKTSIIGPFVDGKALKQTLRILRKVFPYRTCKNLPKKPCLWYQLNRCPAPCLFQTNLGKQIAKTSDSVKQECQRNVRNLIKILRGKKKRVLADLKEEMKKESKNQHFEKAAKIRNQIKALEKVWAHAEFFEDKKQQYALKTPWFNYGGRRIEAYDVSDIQGKDATGAMVTFIDGLPDKNLYRRFKIKLNQGPNDLNMLKEMLLRRFEHAEWGLPDLILIDGGKAHLNIALEIKKQKVILKKIKIVSLAKKENKLYVEGRKEPVMLKILPRPIFNLILQVRDEAHRFAKAYHHTLRKKTLLN